MLSSFLANRIGKPRPLGNAAAFVRAASTSDAGNRARRVLGPLQLPMIPEYQMEAAGHPIAKTIAQVGRLAFPMVSIWVKVPD